MSENGINDGGKVLRFDLPLTFGDVVEVAHCAVGPGRSDDERNAKAKLVYDQAAKCAMENARLLCAVCEFANAPGDVSSLSLAFVSDHVRSANEVYKRYLAAFGDVLRERNAKLAKRMAGGSEDETKSAAKKD